METGRHLEGRAECHLRRVGPVGVTTAARQHEGPGGQDKRRRGGHGDAGRAGGQGHKEELIAEQRRTRADL